MRTPFLQYSYNVRISSCISVFKKCQLPLLYFQRAKHSHHTFFSRPKFAHMQNKTKLFTSRTIYKHIYDLETCDLLNSRSVRILRLCKASFPLSNSDTVNLSLSEISLRHQKTTFLVRDIPITFAIAIVYWEQTLIVVNLEEQEIH